MRDWTMISKWTSVVFFLSGLACLILGAVASATGYDDAVGVSRLVVFGSFLVLVSLTWILSLWA